MKQFLKIHPVDGKIDRTLAITISAAGHRTCCGFETYGVGRDGIETKSAPVNDFGHLICVDVLIYAVRLPMNGEAPTVLLSGILAENNFLNSESLLQEGQSK